jgi:uncharacterized protein YjbI with pentapeptide repeats
MNHDRKKEQFDQSQYELLIRCSEKGDLTQWNKWREANQTVSILLEGANLAGADLWKANLTGANLKNVNLAGADLWEADLKSTDLWNANLKGAELISANLESANLINVNLEGADLWKANLKGAKFISAILNSQTFIWGCDFDDQTTFNVKELSSAKIEPLLKESLKINPNPELLSCRNI